MLGVFGLNYETEENELKHVFKKYGPLEKVKLVTDPRTNRSRGFAFVYFEYEEDAQEAKRRVHGQEIDGSFVRVEYSISNRAHNPTPGVYMGKRYAGGGRYNHDGQYSRSRTPESRSSRRSRSYERRSNLFLLLFFSNKVKIVYKIFKTKDGEVIPEIIKIQNQQK